MGEIVDLVLEGALCQSCGTIVDGSAAGFPRNCEDCEEDSDEI